MVPIKGSSNQAGEVEEEAETQEDGNKENKEVMAGSKEDQHFKTLMVPMRGSSNSQAGEVGKGSELKGQDGKNTENKVTINGRKDYAQV